MDQSHLGFEHVFYTHPDSLWVLSPEEIFYLLDEPPRQTLELPQSAVRIYATVEEFHSRQLLPKGLSPTRLAFIMGNAKGVFEQYYYVLYYIDTARMWIPLGCMEQSQWNQTVQTQSGMLVYTWDRNDELTSYFAEKPSLQLAHMMVQLYRTFLELDPELTSLLKSCSNAHAQTILLHPSLQNRFVRWIQKVAECMHEDGNTSENREFREILQLDEQRNKYFPRHRTTVDPLEYNYGRPLYTEQHAVTWVTDWMGACRWPSHDCSSYVRTLRDVLRQKQVSLVVSIGPNPPHADTIWDPSPTDAKTGEPCEERYFFYFGSIFDPLLDEQPNLALHRIHLDQFQLIRPLDIREWDTNPPYQYGTMYQVWDSVEKRAVQFVHLDHWKDGTCPSASMSRSIELTVQLILEAHRRGERVVIHCIAGQGRTGTLMMCVFAKLISLYGSQPWNSSLSSPSRAWNMIREWIQMRRSRQRMIHSPEQWLYVLRYLSQCNNAPSEQIYFLVPDLPTRYKPQLEDIRNALKDSEYCMTWITNSEQVQRSYQGTLLIQLVEGTMQLHPQASVVTEHSEDPPLRFASPPSRPSMRSPNGSSSVTPSFALSSPSFPKPTARPLPFSHRPKPSVSSSSEEINRVRGRSPPKQWQKQPLTLVLRNEYGEEMQHVFVRAPYFGIYFQHTNRILQMPLTTLEKMVESPHLFMNWMMILQEGMLPSPQTTLLTNLPSISSKSGGLF